VDRKELALASAHLIPIASINTKDSMAAPSGASGILRDAGASVRPSLLASVRADEATN